MNKYTSALFGIFVMILENAISRRSVAAAAAGNGAGRGTGGSIRGSGIEARSRRVFAETVADGTAAAAAAAADAGAGVAEEVLFPMLDFLKKIVQPVGNSESGRDY